jgi:hypothetical protein
MNRELRKAIYNKQMLRNKFEKYHTDKTWEAYRTLLLVKQQKWLSEFCVKMHGSLAKIRVGRVTVNTHIFFFGPVKIQVFAKQGPVF